MNKKTKIFIALGVVLSVSLIVGLTVIAVTGYGSESDPLVALSYLTDTVTPSIKSELSTDLEDAKTEISAQFDQKIADLEARISESGSGNNDTGSYKAFKVVTLSAGQTVTCSVGTEIMLRIGTAQSTGPDIPRLIDETEGTDILYSGTSLQKNHMYMVTIKGNGIKATAATTKILIRGEYTIS